MTDIRSSYDSVADVFYLSVGPKERTRVREGEGGILFRFTSTGTPVGVTVQHYQRWMNKIPHLIVLLDKHLSIGAGQIERALPEHVN